jgi:hypothetical protein
MNRLTRITGQVMLYLACGKEREFDGVLLAVQQSELPLHFVCFWQLTDILCITATFRERFRRATFVTELFAFLNKRCPFPNAAWCTMTLKADLTSPLHGVQWLWKLTWHLHCMVYTKICWGTSDYGRRSLIYWRLGSMAMVLLRGKWMQY